MNLEPRAPLHMLLLIAAVVAFWLCASIGFGLLAMKGLLWLHSLAG